MFETLLFDLDGTLTNPFEGITNAILYALGEMGIHETDRQKLTAFIGPPLLQSFREFYGLDEDDALRATRAFRVYYERQGIYENVPYEGISQALVSLKTRAKQLFVATSKPEPFAVRILERFSLAQYFDGIAGATLDETRTEKAEVIAYALDRFRIPKQGTLMIGDRKHDILGAKQNGLNSLGVLYGFGSREELLTAGADLLCETPARLPEVIS